MHILVTGMSGLIGAALRAHLEAEPVSPDMRLSALNRSAVDGLPTTRASLDDFEAITPAFREVDTVVHLAAEISDAAGWPALLATNITGTRNVLEAAHRAGVKRFVFASSGATVAGWEQDEPYTALIQGRYDSLPARWPLIDESMPTRPANVYASTKVWGEALAGQYADRFDLEVICLRIGFANQEDRPLDARHYSVWNSQRDVAQAFRLAAGLRMSSTFETFFVLSDNRYGYRDISKARSVLGFSPEDSADTFGEPPR